MSFQIPLQTEIEKHIKEKKGWPEQFCRYYAERFWNFYNSNGWKVSGRAAMKSWQSAFAAQWQTLKFKEDIEFLNKCMSKEPSINGATREICYLNDCLVDYRKNYDSIPKERYVALYDYLKEKKLIRMTRAEIESVKEFYNDVRKGKEMCIKIIFDRMITNGERF